jgi:hypothetical protein
VSVEAAAYLEAEAAAIVADAVSKVTVTVAVVPLSVAVVIVPVSGVVLTEDRLSLTFLPTHLVTPVTVAGTVTVNVAVVPVTPETEGDGSVVTIHAVRSKYPTTAKIMTITPITTNALVDNCNMVGFYINNKINLY